jgi:hypothetical protein
MTRSISSFRVASPEVYLASNSDRGRTMPPIRVGLAPAIIFVVTLAGCSSGGPQTLGADAAVDVWVGADEGLPDAADATDAAAEVSVATLDEACRAAVTAECRRYGTCEQAPSTEACLDAFVDLCPAYYFNAESTRTAVDAQACATAFAQLPCTDLDLGIFPPCLALGTKPGGSACVYNSQCQTGSCNGNDRCVECFGDLVVAGAPCDSSHFCDRQSFCHPAEHVCMAVATILHAAEGQPCDLQADPVVGCVADLKCIPLEAAGSAGTCTHYPMAGEPCLAPSVSSHPCAEGFECGDGDACWPVNTCSGTMTCDPTSACVRGDGGMSCLPLGGEGAACGGTDFPACNSTTVCAFSTAAATTEACTRFVPKGGACDTSHPCAGNLLCTAGICDALDPATCSADAGVD